MTANLLSDLDHPAYHLAVKLPKYNRRVTVFQATTPLDAAHILKRANPAWTKEDHQQLSQAHATRGRQLNERYSQLLDEAALETFGRKFLPTDYHISAIGREEFSPEKKVALRNAAHASTYHQYAARAHAKAANPRSRTRL